MSASKNYSAEDVENIPLRMSVEKTIPVRIVFANNYSVEDVSLKKYSGEDLLHNNYSHEDVVKNNYSHEDLAQNKRVYFVVVEGNKESEKEVVGGGGSDATIDEVLGEDANGSRDIVLRVYIKQRLSGKKVLEGRGFMQNFF